MGEPVDPLTTAIAYLLDQGELLALTEGRVAGKHRFAQADAADGSPRGWGGAAKALTLRLAGGDGVDPINCADAAQARVRLEARAWGESQADAARVWGLLELVCRRFTRATVALPDGRQALMFVLWPVGDGPQGETDPETGIDYLRGTLRVWVAAEALATGV